MREVHFPSRYIANKPLREFIITKLIGEVMREGYPLFEVPLSRVVRLRYNKYEETIRINKRHVNNRSKP